MIQGPAFLPTSAKVPLQSAPEGHHRVRLKFKSEKLDYRVKGGAKYNNKLEFLLQATAKIVLKSVSENGAP
jgi:hypothetical protein